jgi:erythronate-4-phosphate dehydrogenase
MTIGIIGVGNVGKKVAQAAQALGMHVVLNDPPREELEGSAQFTTLDQLLEVSDIVTLHTPLTKNNPYPTFHLADDTFFGKMKTGAVFINAARGEVTDSTALKKAIENKITDCILDVWEGEPNNIDQTLIQQATIATPHIAGYSADGKANGTAQCVHEIAKYFHINELENWYPTELPQPPMPATFHINCTGKSTQQIVYEAVTHTYPITEDSRKLKENHKAFEMLRGKYWVRREFQCFKVTLEGQDNQHARCVLQELGFQVE